MGDGAFWDWVYSNENEQLRQDLGYEVTVNLDKKEIIDLARRSMRLRRKYGVRYAQATKEAPSYAYDFDHDPSLKVVAFDTAQQVGDLITITPPSTQDEFCDFVLELLREFQRLIEDKGIWKSLWNNGTHRDEKDAQRIFFTSAVHVCLLNDVDMSPEADEGVGPVDFKFSRGSRRKALAELKLASSSHFWDNLEEQVPAYLKAAAIECGYFVVIQFENEHCEEDFKKRVRRIVREVGKKTDRKYRVIFVDARKRLSASKRTRKSGAVRKAPPAKKAARARKATKAVKKRSS